MKGTILLNHIENTHQIEDEEKARFLRGLLTQMFENTDVVAKIEEIWADDGPLVPVQKVKMRKLLDDFHIQIIDDLDGGLCIYVDGEKIGEWLKCKYKLKRDLSQLDRKKQLYLEMSVECWSVFEMADEQNA